MSGRRPRWQAGRTGLANSRRRRAGYTVLNAAAGARFTFGGRLNVLTVSLANAANAEYRNHLSRVKEIMPEAARSLNVSYRVVF